MILVKLSKIPLLANKKSQTVHEISSLSQVIGLAAYKLQLVSGCVHGLTLVSEYRSAEARESVAGLIFFSSIPSCVFKHCAKCP